MLFSSFDSLIYCFIYCVLPLDILYTHNVFIDHVLIKLIFCISKKEAIHHSRKALKNPVYSRNAKISKVDIWRQKTRNRNRIWYPMRKIQNGKRQNETSFDFPSEKHILNLLSATAVTVCWRWEGCTNDKIYSIWHTSNGGLTLNTVKTKCIGEIK